MERKFLEIRAQGAGALGKSNLVGTCTCGAEILEGTDSYGVGVKEIS